MEPQSPGAKIMPGRFAWLDAWRQVVCLIVINTVGLMAPSFGQPVSTLGAASFVAAGSALDQVEAALARADLSAQRLAELRGTLGSARDGLGAQLSELEPWLAEADARLKEIGPAPARDAPAEPPAPAAERERLSQTFGDPDATVKQVRLLLV